MQQILGSLQKSQLPTVNEALTGNKFLCLVKVHGNNPVLNQQAKERLTLDRDLAGDEEKAIAELSEQDRRERQELLASMANQLSTKLDGSLLVILTMKLVFH